MPKRFVNSLRRSLKHYYPHFFGINKALKKREFAPNFRKNSEMPIFSASYPLKKTGLIPKVKYEKN